jgi:hypothetical protein
MPDLRRLLNGARPPRPDADASRSILTLLAILTVVGLLPVLVLGAGAVAVSTGTLAAVWLLARRYGVRLR